MKLEMVASVVFAWLRGSQVASLFIRFSLCPQSICSTPLSLFPFLLCSICLRMPVVFCSSVIASFHNHDDARGTVRNSRIALFVVTTRNRLNMSVRNANDNRLSFSAFFFFFFLAFQIVQLKMRCLPTVDLPQSVCPSYVQFASAARDM